MPKGIGRVIQVGFAKEAVRGTAEATVGFWVPNMEFAAEEKLDQVLEQQAQGVVEGSTDMKIVGQASEISVKGAITDKNFPLILLATLGSLSSVAESAPNALAYDHTITVAQSAQHQSLTVFKNDPLSAVDYKYPLCCVDSLELTYKFGELIQFDLKMKGKKGTSATLTPAASAENLFLPKHVSFKLASAVAGLDAASAVVIKNLKIKFNKGLEQDNVLGSNDPADFLNKQIEITGQLEAVWQNETDFQSAFLAGTTQAMRIDLKNTDITIATSANPEIKIDLNKVSFSAVTKPFKVGDVVIQTVAFQAHYKTTETKMVSIVATNLQASY